jgi:hypothetical protein
LTWLAPVNDGGEMPGRYKTIIGSELPFVKSGCNHTNSINREARKEREESSKTIKNLFFVFLGDLRGKNGFGSTQTRKL